MAKSLSIEKFFIVMVLFSLTACSDIPDSDYSDVEFMEEGATEEGSTEEEFTEEGSTEEGSTEEEFTEEGAKGGGSTGGGSTGGGSTEEGATEEGATEEGATEEGSTGEGSTGGSAREGSTEAGSTEDTQDTALIEPDDYRIILSVDSVINKNETGILKIWIGAPDIEVYFSEGVVQDETTIPSSIGKYAKITPVAPDFEVKNLTEDKCHKIHPSGSEVRFLLTPKTTGTYKVSANIEIYEATDCNGTSIPKTAETLSVTVNVNTKKEISKKFHKLGNIIWEKFLTFWGALITLVFTFLLFLIRRKIKRKTNFDETE